MKVGPIQIVRMTKSEFCELDERDENELGQPLPPQLELARLASSLEHSVTAPADSTIPDCRKCGVCCGIAPIVSVKLAESERVGTYLEITDDTEPDVVVDRVLERDFARGRCAHLKGEVGESVECSIYERRPDVCRRFEAGSDRCLEFRRMYRLDPQLGADEVAGLASRLKERKRGVITDAVCSVSSVKMSAKRGKDEPDRVVLEKTVLMRIQAVVDDEIDDWIELHKYNPDRETWLQSELVGMTLNEARELIASRVQQGVSN